MCVEKINNIPCPKCESLNIIYDYQECCFICCDCKHGWSDYYDE